MKKNALLISFIIVLIIGGLLLTSILLNDRDRVQDLVSGDFSIEKFVQSSEEIPLKEKVKKISSDEIYMALEIKKGSPKIVVSSYKKKIFDVNDYLKYSVEDGVLYIDSTEKSKKMSGLEKFFVVTVYVEDSKSVDIEIGTLAGAFTAEDDLKSVQIGKLAGALNLDNQLSSLNINSTEGVLNLTCQDSYNMEFGTIKGVANFNIRHPNLKLTIQSMSGIIGVFGKNYTADEQKSLDTSYGDGSKSIRIDSVEGVLNME